MDERIMDMVSLITDQVRTRQDLFRNEGKIMDSLVSSGYRIHEADAALTLLQTLSRDSSEAGEPALPAGGIRSMTAEERSRFTIEAFGFITKLAHLGIISGDLREELLAKALTLHTGRIELDQVRSLLAVDLLDGDRDYEHFLDPASEDKGTVWN